jgi:hypothetical protein
VPQLTEILTRMPTASAWNACYMTLEEAEIVEVTLKKIRELNHLDAKIRRLHKEGKHDEVCEIALKLKSALMDNREDELRSYPNLK